MDDLMITVNSKCVEVTQEIADVLCTGETTDTVAFSDKLGAPIDYNKPFNIRDLGLEIKG